MHFAFFVVSHGIFLQAIGDRGIVDDYGGIFWCGIDEQFKDVEEFSGVASTEAYEGFRLFQFKLAFAQ